MSEHTKNIPTRNDKKLELANLQKALVKYLKSLKKKDRYQFFHFPVNDTFAPGYSNIISHPMCFEIMQEKVDKMEYESLEQFKDDFILVCSNACTYNAPGTIYFTEADKLRQYGEKILVPIQYVPISSVDSVAIVDEKSKQQVGSENPSRSKSRSTPKLTRVQEELLKSMTHRSETTSNRNSLPCSQSNTGNSVRTDNIPSNRQVHVKRQRLRNLNQKHIIEQDPSVFFQFDPQDVADSSLEAYQKVHALTNASQSKIYNIDVFSKKILRCRLLDGEQSVTAGHRINVPQTDNNFQSTPLSLPVYAFPMEDLFITTKERPEDTPFSSKLVHDIWSNSEFAILQQEFLEGTHEEVCNMIQIFGSLIGACYSLNMLSFIGDCADPVRKMVNILLDTITDKKSSDFIKQKTENLPKNSQIIGKSFVDDIIMTIQDSNADPVKKESLVKAICKIRLFLKALLQNNWKLIIQICALKSVDRTSLKASATELAHTMKKILTTINAIPTDSPNTNLNSLIMH